AVHAAVHEAQGVAHVLGEALRLVLELEQHARAIVAQAVEGDDARVLVAGRAAPGDAVVGRLLRDDGVPLLHLAADIGAPMQVGVVELADLLDAFHEARERLELSPLVVGGAHGHVDVDVLLDLRHGLLLPGPAGPSVGAAPAPTSGAAPLAGSRRHARRERAASERPVSLADGDRHRPGRVVPVAEAVPLHLAGLAVAGLVG